MRNSNSKVVRRAVESYVMECVSDTLDRCEAVDTLQPVDYVFDTLSDECKYQQCHAGKVDVIGDGLAEEYRKAGRAINVPVANTPYWVWYLAAGIGSFEVYYSEARKLLAEWLGETPCESDQFSNERVWQLYCHLTALAFGRLHKKETRTRRS